MVMGHDVIRFGYGIEAARAERPAAEESADGEPEATAGAVHLERFDCVAGAARREPAWRWATVERPLIPAHRRDQPPSTDGGVRVVRVVDAHGVLMMRDISRSRSAASSLNDRSAAAGLAPMRYKPAGR